MVWKEKIAALIADRDKRDALKMLFDCAANGCPDEFIQTLVEKFPFLPADYLEFLRFTDGAQLDLFVLFGSGESSFPPLESLMRRWAEVLPPREACPIGEDSGGGVFWIAPDGRVHLHYIDSAESEALAQSYGELLSEVFLGPRYLSLFPRGATARNEWLLYLREKGWA
ncbi:MAG TPA: SMI1/KNR4 family protein [Acidobacteriota bacterium]|nr:SMI1/KNR4 family protein [Acidobacteriota bacterium]